MYLLSNIYIYVDLHPYFLPMFRVVLNDVLFTTHQGAMCRDTSRSSQSGVSLYHDFGLMLEPQTLNFQSNPTKVYASVCNYVYKYQVIYSLLILKDRLVFLLDLCLPPAEKENFVIGQTSSKSDTNILVRAGKDDISCRS